MGVDVERDKRMMTAADAIFVVAWRHDKWTARANRDLGWSLQTILLNDDVSSP